MINLLTMLAWRRLFKQAKANNEVLWATMDTMDEQVSLFILPIKVGWVLMTYVVMDHDDENQVVAMSTAPIWSFSYVNHGSSSRIRQRLENLYQGDRDQGLDDEDEDADADDEGEDVESR